MLEATRVCTVNTQYPINERLMDYKDIACGVYQDMLKMDEHIKGVSLPPKKNSPT